MARKRSTKRKGRTRASALARAASLDIAEKPALVISGGGAHGAFAVGAVDVLFNETGLDFDIFVGTSTGALVSSLAIIKDVAALTDIYTSVSQKDILEPNGIFELLTVKDGIWSTAPLKRLIDDKLTLARFKKIMDSPKTLIFTAVNLKTGRLEYWSTKPVDVPISSGEVKVIGKNDIETFKRALLASASEPVFMTTVQIQNNGARYTDGGLREIAGVEVAIELGATSVHTIVMAPEDSQIPDDDKNTYNLIQMAFRAVDLAAREISKSDVEVGKLNLQAVNYIRHVEEAYLNARVVADDLLANNVITTQHYQTMFPDNSIDKNRNPFKHKANFRSLYIIRPRKETMLEGTGLDFDPVIMKNNLQRGKTEGRRPVRVPEFTVMASPEVVRARGLAQVKAMPKGKKAKPKKGKGAATRALSTATSEPLTEAKVHALLLRSIQSARRRPDLTWNDLKDVKIEESPFENSPFPSQEQCIDFVQAIFQAELVKVYPEADTLLLGVFWSHKKFTWKLFAPTLFDLVA
jgi:NTE family protein